MDLIEVYSWLREQRDRVKFLPIILLSQSLKHPEEKRQMVFCIFRTIDTVRTMGIWRLVNYRKEPIMNICDSFSRSSPWAAAWRMLPNPNRTEQRGQKILNRVQKTKQVRMPERSDDRKKNATLKLAIGNLPGIKVHWGATKAEAPSRKLIDRPLGSNGAVSIGLKSSAGLSD